MQPHNNSSESEERELTLEELLTEELESEALVAVPSSSGFPIPVAGRRFAARQSSRQHGERGGLQRSLWVWLCAGFATVGVMAVLLEVPLTYHIPANILREWRVLHEPSIRRAYLRGQCHRQDEDSAKKACLETELSPYNQSSTNEN